MANEQRREKKKTMEEVIGEAAERGARKALALQARELEVNYYRAMEDLLRAYPKRRRILEHPEEFEFFPVGKSKDISIAPPKGSGVVDKISVTEAYVDERKRAYAQELALFSETEYAIAHFKHLPEFAVIRLVYFNEDIEGNDRGEGAKRYTWDQIACELDKIGVEKTITVIRRWRSRLVRDMTVMMFGARGAVNVNTKESKKGKGEGNVAEVEDTEGAVRAEDTGAERLSVEGGEL